MDFIKAAYFEEASRMSLADVDKPTIQNPDDVIIRVIRTCVCGSDLWSYKEGDQKEAHPINGGHEAIGIVEETGEKITTVKTGDFVIAPSPTAAANARPAGTASMGPATIIPPLPTGATASNPSTCVSTTPTGLWSKCRASLRITPKGCSSPC